MLLLYTGRRPKRRGSHPLGLGLLLTGALVLAGFLWQAATAVWAVEVGGHQVAVARDHREVDRAVASLERTYGPDAALEGVRVVQVPAARNQEFTGAAEIENRLADALGLQKRAVGVAIDGKVRFCFTDRSTALAFLDQLKKGYPADPGAEVGFLQDVRLVEVRVPVSELHSVEDALAAAARARRQNKEYIVKDGDTLWDIAIKHGLSVDELLAANPGLSEDTVLALGQSLNVGKVQPLLTVVATARLRETVPIPYPVTVKKDSSLALGKRQVIKPGRQGQKEFIVEVTRYNGRLVSRRMIDSRVLQQPVVQVEARGTKLMLASRGGGHLIWPARGGITSTYGRRGDGMHTGIDIGADAGAPVVAAEAGQVISAGWAGGYGRCVEIAHGGGVVTRYAHLSRISVSVGEEVERGERIGSVGSTGNATGPHLHFEILVNGSPRNPLNYL
ncbi:MAG: M23 family metallopeptidase [Bacillota bacterium]|nr:M23 family metallopeptidase [Bacillota bacterium]